MGVLYAAALMEENNSVNKTIIENRDLKLIPVYLIVIIYILLC